MHRSICDHLDRVARGETDRLLLLCPPQHGKSTLASRRFPAYILGREPQRDIIATSATAELAAQFGRDLRNCIGSSEYARIFPGTTLSEDSHAKGRWNTAQGGGLYTIGFGGALLGRGGDGGLIDDPFATWEDAQSKLQRDKVWEWYRGTFYNRIRPGGWIIVIQHRMHEEDLAGRLIAEMANGKDRWEIVEFPADLENPPWVERYDRRALERIKVNTSSLQWSALYLQNPMPDEGTFFQREWFWRFDPKDVPRQAYKYTTGDFAVTDGKGDSTDIGTHGYIDQKLYLGLDGWSGQTTADIWIEKLCNQFARHRPLCFFGESGVIRRAIEPFLIRRMRERASYCRLEWLVRTHDKPTMARPLQAMAANQCVGIANTDFGDRLFRSLLQFPTAQQDDPVDMAALMAMAVANAHPAITSATAEDREELLDDYEYVANNNDVRDWRVM